MRLELTKSEEEGKAILLQVVCGRGGMVDTLVLEASAFGVRVRVSPSALSQNPRFFQIPNHNKHSYHSLLHWRYHLRVLAKKLG